MLSDTLSQAYDEIEMYREENPDIYGDMRGDLEILLGLMESMRRRLDIAPPDDDAPAIERMRECFENPEQARTFYLETAEAMRRIRHDLPVPTA